MSNDAIISSESPESCIAEVVPTRTRTISVVGRLNPERRAGLALDALALLLRDGLDVRLQFVGDYDSPSHRLYVRDLRDRAELGILAGRVTFNGFLDDPIPTMRLSDVIVNPRDNEPFGLVTLEAWAAGTPFVGADTGGPSEVVTHAVDGLLFRSGDAADLATQIERILVDSAFAERLVLNAYASLDGIQQANSVSRDMLARSVRLLWEGGTICRL